MLWCTSLIFMDETLLRRLNIMSPADYYSGGADISSLKSLFHAPLLYYGADQVILCCLVLIGGDTEVWELWKSSLKFNFLISYCKQLSKMWFIMTIDP